MDYFFINGPSLDDVAVRYHELTGITELPPLWAMGFHQCRWSYYPESRVRELAADFREKKIPCDALYLDIDYMDGYRCFTWNKEHFPDPAKMISDLRDDGFHTVVMIDPGIRVDPDYHVYADGMEGDMFCRRPDGTHMIGPVWPPECVWPDYTDPEVRDWWGDLYKELYLEQGVSGFWNDMNEPAVFKVNALTFPEDVRHHYEGYGADHKKAHNIYGMQMTRATWDGLRRLKPEKRPFLLGRASFAGGQRYAALWTGDNVASWEHLAIANRQCLRLAISGYSLVGTDIGGFVDDPTPEMLTRWLQLAVFHPVMRVHSMGNNEDGAAEVEAEAVKEAEKLNRQDQEPWVHGKKHTKLNRSAIKMRYRLLPYLYTVMKRHVEVGTPVLRNMFFYDQKDPYCRKFPDQFPVWG
jgi:alpha-glucosidase